MLVWRTDIATCDYSLGWEGKKFIKDQIMKEFTAGGKELECIFNCNGKLLNCFEQCIFIKLYSGNSNGETMTMGWK